MGIAVHSWREFPDWIIGRPEDPDHARNDDSGDRSATSVVAADPDTCQEGFRPRIARVRPHRIFDHGAARIDDGGYGTGFHTYNGAPIRGEPVHEPCAAARRGTIQGTP